MSANPTSRPSFSPGSRWKIGLDVVLRTVLVLAVAVMANYLGAKFYHRFYLNQQTSTALSSRTLSVLQALTNHVEVTLYFDRKADFYSDIVELLNAYRSANKNISIRTVDYLRDAGAAAAAKDKYNLPGSVDSPNAPPSKDLIIFDAGAGKQPIVVPGEAIVQTKLERIAPSNPGQKEMEFRRKPTDFYGEVLFTAKLLALENPQPLKAYFLQGHGESSLSDSSNYGYSKFALALAQNYIQPQNLELTGENGVPEDCNLLIIAAPSKALDEEELKKIDHYLSDGGRLLVLFNYATVEHQTGLEPILQHWGVNVYPDFVKDQNSKTDDIVVRRFSNHTVVAQLAQLKLQMIRPRRIAHVEWQKPPANAPQVEELAFSSDNSIVVGDPGTPPRSYPLMAAVDQKPVAGISNPRGTTRIIVTGDSLFLGNYLIEAGGNRDFVGYAANWLCNREKLLTGIDPRPVTEFRLLLTQKQHQQIRWLLLGALPGGVLVLGWLVWLVRRK